MYCTDSLTRDVTLWHRAIKTEATETQQRVRKFVFAVQLTYITA
jgi:hypothetical protein